MQQANLLTPEPRRPATGDEALARIDQALAEAMPLERPTPVSSPLTARLSDLFTLRLLSAAITSPTSVSLTVSVEGSFAPPGNRVAVGPTVVVWTVPATVLPTG
jgi:hypothetical protein